MVVYRCSTKSPYEGYSNACHNIQVASSENKPSGYMHAAKALIRLGICVVRSEPSLFSNRIIGICTVEHTDVQHYAF